MSTTQVSIRLNIEGKAEVKRAFDEVAVSGTAAFRGIASAMDAAGAATDRETQRLQRLAQAAKQAAAAEQAQRAFNQVLGIGTAPPKSARESAAVFEEAAKAAEDLERRTEALRAQIDPLGAAQKRLNAEIAEARRQANLGRIEAEARELSLRVGEAVRDIVPGTETIRQLEAVRGSLGRLLEDPLAAKHVGNLRDVEDAIAGSRRRWKAIAECAPCRTVEWLGPDFDPNVVDVAGIEKELAKLAKRWSRPKRQR